MKPILKAVQTNNHPATTDNLFISGMQAQTEEFVAVGALSAAYAELWAVTDSQHGPTRKKYERAVAALITALRNNRRIA